jgi:hypothetical protein
MARILTRDEYVALKTSLLPEIISSYRRIVKISEMLSEDWKPSRKQGLVPNDEQLVDLMKEMYQESNDIITACTALKNGLITLAQRLEQERNLEILP